MSQLNAIAAMSLNRVIGMEGKIPWNCPEDLAFFKKMTLNQSLLMGRKTFESIGFPLPNRKTIILSKQKSFINKFDISSEKNKNCNIISSFKEFFDFIEDEKPETIWVCGGSEIYEQFLEHCDNLYLTIIQKNISGDTFFPEFEKLFKKERVILENNDFVIKHFFK